MQATIIIPAYQPTAVLLELITELRFVRPQQTIIVVDDGSTQPEAKAVLTKLNGVNLVKHRVNFGKGQALKTGFRTYLLHADATSPGVVTADADGQHAIADMINLCEKLEGHPESLHLGARHFSKQIPFRSQIGNRCTRFIFKKMLKISIRDTQTGLRGIPKDFLTRLLLLESKGYEFEMEMLLEAGRQKIPIRETDIATIYQDNNRSSHFKPLKDSFKIYRSLFFHRTVKKTTDPAVF
ncbi:MAG: hypothetical protein A3F10_06605 [Coxiella sp. RIFCSPHIGHO2_12_FULL_42_15]|nr:MAG: hypothetical protein A3F10_06605 [Coxiella sp. RIFCSPHIGHO2_12_FULL_42_15]